MIFQRLKLIIAIFNYSSSEVEYYHQNIAYIRAKRITFNLNSKAYPPSQLALPNFDNEAAYY